MEYTHAEMAIGLRQLADWVEAHPEISQPYNGIEISNCSVEDTKESARNMALAMGRADKVVGNDLFYLVKKFGPAVTYKAVFNREAVCERVVVGVKYIPETVLPARSETVVPASSVEIVEWRCTPVMEAAAQ